MFVKDVSLNKNNMKPYIQLETRTHYDGEYNHTVSMIGISYTACRFSEDDWYKQISIGLGLFGITIGIKK